VRFLGKAKSGSEVTRVFAQAKTRTLDVEGLPLLPCRKRRRGVLLPRQGRGLQGEQRLHVKGARSVSYILNLIIVINKSKLPVRGWLICEVDFGFVSF